ncbi:MAG: hypothetical protein ACK4SP_15710 [Sphingomonas parapaucimobilis]
MNDTIAARVARSFEHQDSAALCPDESKDAVESGPMEGQAHP